MTTLSRQSRTEVGRQTLLAIGVVFCPLAAWGDDPVAHGFELRNQNPFLQIFGLPTFQSATLVPEGEFRSRVSLDLANNSDAGETPAESVVIDGESYFLTMSIRRRMTAWLELGVDIPVVTHSSGFMDHAIESWHDIFGISNTKRRGAGNELNFHYERDGNTVHQLTAPTTGLGDVQVTGAIPIRHSGAGGADISLRASLKLPTGDETRLHGSGAMDFAVGLYTAGTRTILDHDLGLGGFLGAIVLGDGDVMPEMQRSAVAFGGASMTWQATDRFALTTQLYVQGPYFNSDVTELGGKTMQLAVGADYRTSKRDLTLRLALVEDISADATTDFALHFEIAGGGGS